MEYIDGINVCIPKGCSLKSNKRGFTVYCEDGESTVATTEVAILQNKNVFPITECKEQGYKKIKNFRTS
jgi:uncharacterized pyridoxamine 5'-phosphate oxidase family protein